MLSLNRSFQLLKMQTTLRVFLKKRCHHLFPPVPVCSVLDTLAHTNQYAPRGVETDKTPPHPKSIQPPGCKVCRCWGSGMLTGRGGLGPRCAHTPACRLLPASRAPTANSALSPDHRAVSCWAVTSQFAVIKRKGGWGRGQVVKYYLFAQATRAEAISCPSNQGQRANVFSRHGCS